MFFSFYVKFTFNKCRNQNCIFTDFDNTDLCVFQTPIQIEIITITPLSMFFKNNFNPYSFLSDL